MNHWNPLFLHWNPLQIVSPNPIGCSGFGSGIHQMFAFSTHYLSGKEITIQVKPMLHPRNSKITRFGRWIDSPLMNAASWGGVAGIALYRAVMGEWLLLLVCGLGGLFLALLQQHWKSIPPFYRFKLLFGSGVLLGWLMLTSHMPAHALFFDTLENGLKTLFNRFGVADLDKIPDWIGGIFRIFGILTVVFLAIRFGRSQNDDEEGGRMVINKAVVIIAALLVGDALLNIFIN